MYTESELLGQLALHVISNVVVVVVVVVVVAAAAATAAAVAVAAIAAAAAAVVKAFDLGKSIKNMFIIGLRSDAYGSIAFKLGLIIHKTKP